MPIKRKSFFGRQLGISETPSSRAARLIRLVDEFTMAEEENLRNLNTSLLNAAMGVQTPAPQSSNMSENLHQGSLTSRYVSREPGSAIVHHLSSPDPSPSDQRAAKRQVTTWQGFEATNQQNLIGAMNSNQPAVPVNLGPFFDSVRSNPTSAVNQQAQQAPATPNNMRFMSTSQLITPVPGLPGVWRTFDPMVYGQSAASPGTVWTVGGLPTSMFSPQNYYAPATPTPGPQVTTAHQLAPSPPHTGFQGHMQLSQPSFSGVAPMSNQSGPSYQMALQMSSANQHPATQGPPAATIVSVPTSSGSDSHHDTLFSHDHSQTHSLQSFSVAAGMLRPEGGDPAGGPSTQPETINPLALMIKPTAGPLQFRPSWVFNEKDGVLRFWAGDDATEEHLQVALKTKRSPRLEDEATLAPQWHELHASQFEGKRPLATLVTTWWRLIEAFHDVVDLQEFVAEQGEELALDDDVRLAQQLEEARKESRISPRFKVSDLHTWLNDPENGWLALMHRRRMRDRPEAARVKDSHPMSVQSEPSTGILPLAPNLPPPPPSVLSTGASGAGPAPQPSQFVPWDTEGSVANHVAIAPHRIPIVAEIYRAQNAMLNASNSLVHGKDGLMDAARTSEMVEAQGSAWDHASTVLMRLAAMDLEEVKAARASIIEMLSIPGISESARDKGANMLLDLAKLTRRKAEDYQPLFERLKWTLQLTGSGPVHHQPEASGQVHGPSEAFGQVYNRSA
ncbi:hypothetical protein FS749_013955 [Ceratobasidium sp. UAMH 11750]|nr:hypothetical protein FS749_013955 [Ceratobasidium sp. UAMH 11750]